MTGYANPVLPGFHPDPSVCRVGDEYFLVTSTFTWCPGVPIFRSPNLVDWQQIGSILDRPSQLDLSTSLGWSSLGVFAPTIRHHDGRFWMITTNVGTAGSKTFFVTAEDPAGPWTDPTFIDIDGIDPDLAWDRDGRCWLHFSRGPEGIARCRVDDQTGEVLEGPEPTWSGTGLQYPEAPHLNERDGTWYLLIAEGGTASGHAVSIARGPGPTGPWTGSPDNPILSHRSTDRPIQNTGHADLIEATDGSWWMVLLGVRPRGLNDGFHVLGRETFLAPVRWVDGWPVVEPVELEVGRRPPGPTAGVESDRHDDDFNDLRLGPSWLAIRRQPSELVSLEDRPGWLTLQGTEATLDEDLAVLVGRRQQHPWCRVRTLVDPRNSAEAGLTVYLDETAHCEIAVRGDRIVAKARAGDHDLALADAPVPSTPVILQAETRPHPHGPDMISLGFAVGDSAVQPLAEVDGRFLSTEFTGGFLGRVLGMYAVGGEASFDWFTYEEAT